MDEGGSFQREILMGWGAMLKEICRGDSYCRGECRCEWHELGVNLRKRGERVSYAVDRCGGECGLKFHSRMKRSSKPMIGQLKCCTCH